MTDPLYDPKGDPKADRTGDNADPQLAELETLLGGYAHRAPLRELPPRRPWRTPALVGAGAVAAAALAVLVLVRRGQGAETAETAECPSGGAGFAFDVTGGPARCAGGMASRGALPVGAWLETTGAAIADVRIADIGELTVFSGSRLRLVGTGTAEHRLELARGRVSARVTAPPRLFVVDTPVASAVDLGCAYDLSVDDDGRTRLHVTAGAVSLEGHGLVAYAPMGTEVVAAAGRGPGTPVAVGASPELVAAVARFDAGGAAALRAILALAGARDSFTLWNLLARTAAGDRAAVIARLDQISPRPAWVSADAVLAGETAAIEAWRVAIQQRWICPGCATKSKR
jgi:hypothetical protein